MIWGYYDAYVRLPGRSEPFRLLMRFKWPVTYRRAELEVLRAVRAIRKTGRLRFSGRIRLMQLGSICAPWVRP